MRYFLLIPGLLCYFYALETCFNRAPFYNDLAVELAELFDSAGQTIDLHFYRLAELETLRESLSNALERGVVVRIITDSDEYSPWYLKLPGDVSACNDRGTSFALTNDHESHNKFAVVDSRKVWTGSYNANVWGGSWSAQNVIILDDTELAGFYQAEFSYMWDAGLFGTARQSVPGRQSFIDFPSRGITLAFSPPTPGLPGAKELLMETISSARQSICFSIFTFTDDDISALLSNRIKEGIAVFGIFEERQVYVNGGEYDGLKSAFPDNFICDKVLGEMGDLHHKYLLADPGTDDASVVTGSCNWTEKGFFENDENMICLRDRNVCADFLTEFRERVSEAGAQMIFDNVRILQIDNPDGDHSSKERVMLDPVIRGDSCLDLSIAPAPLQVSIYAENGDVIYQSADVPEYLRLSEQGWRSGVFFLVVDFKGEIQVMKKLVYIK